MLREILTKKEILKNCKIFRMLATQAEKEHASFHTPGHKVHGFDITELSYSDNLSSPKSCILEAERDVAEILGARRSFLLTDGSTCGILSMLYAAKQLGAKNIAFCESTHKSVFNGCAALGLTPLVYPSSKREEIPFAPTMSALSEKNGEIFAAADAILFTSPDYYGNVADLRGAREFCDKNGKILLVDGAHGGHLHFEKELHAGTYADMWVDGVHKSLPALTQGAIVSAKSEKFAQALQKGVDIFRTTSPSYPIMASVEYAVKYPRKVTLEKRVNLFKKRYARIYQNADWTKLCARFGKHAFQVEKILEEEGIFAEFCDGNVLMFYLSPATRMQDFDRLKTRLTELFVQFPDYEPKKSKKENELDPAPLVFDKNAETEWVDMDGAEGRICANNCGLFPPCTPLILQGERIEKEKLRLMRQANNLFGVQDGKILVLKNKDKE